MAAHLLIVEGNTPELALAAQRATGRTPAIGYARALKAIDMDLSFSFAQPYFSNHDIESLDMGGYDGVVVTGSGVEWSGADERARPFWEIYEKTFAAGAPAFGSCWGMQTAAVALGGETKAGPNGVEAGFARGVRPADHPMTAGRRDGFDVIAMHRDDVTRAPEGAVVTAVSDHTAIQAFAYDRGEVSFWGVQYHPECELTDVAYWFSRSDDAALKAKAREVKSVAEDPLTYARLCAKHRIGVDILDRRYHRTELANWLAAKVRPHMRSAGRDSPAGA